MLSAANDSDDLIELQAVIDEFTRLESTLVNEPTIFEIAGFPSRENVFSNFLKFYFDDRNKHGFGCKLLRALMMDIKEFTDEELHVINIRREVATKSLKRIDLVIETGYVVIAIENKVYHVLNNDLDDYSNYLANIFPSKPVFKIVLNLTEHKPQPEENRFVFISYRRFIENLQTLLPNVANSNRYEVFYNEFLQNLKNHFPNMMTDEQVAFLFKNEDAIGKIVELAKRSTNFINAIASAIKTRIIYDSNRWQPYQEIAGSFEFHSLSEKPFIRVACTVEINKLYIEVNINSLGIELERYLSQLDFGTAQPSPGWFYVKEISPINKIKEEEVAYELSVLIALLEKFVESMNLKEANHV